MRKADYDSTIEVTTDQGASWQRVDLAQPDGSNILAIVPAPANQEHGLSYVLGSYGLWRVRDNGTTVEQWADPRLAGRTYTNTLLSLAVSPILADGGHRLFIGTFAGEFWPVDPAAATWQPLASAAPPPTEPTPAEPTATGPTPAEPTPTEVATVAPVLLPTPTPPLTLPTATSIPGTLQPLPDEPPAGRFRPTGRFADLWAADETLQSRLGYARSERAVELPAAMQTFEQGLMLWRSDELRIYAIYSDGTWDLFDDTFREGEQELDPSIVPPADRLQPIRGFGKVWRSSPKVHAGLGWATDKEDGFTATVQDFEHGSIVRLPGVIYALVLEADGRRTWTVVG